MNQILINASNKEETRVALLDNKELVGLNVESSLIKKNKGNVYKGKITRIEITLNAAFVDYGRDKKGFLPFKEVDKKYFKNKNNEEADISALEEGQEIIIQVEKEERGNKGASLTTYISLAGAYSIFIPNSSKGIGISKQINQNDRQTLQKELESLVIPKESNLIVRTSGADKTAIELQWEVDYLLKLWQIIEKVADKNKAPLLIYKENDIIVRTLRDYLRDNISSVYIDDKKTFEEAKDFVTFVMPKYLDKIKFYDDSSQSLFSFIGVEKQVHNVFDREVSLKSGGTIVFDTTEALTAIDINSAKSKKGSNIEEVALHTNIEAAKEIAKQCKLRDLGGLLVIDFIDMTEESHKEQVENTIKQAIKGDKSRVQLSQISKFGLMEMSRQRLNPSVLESTKKVCNVCGGSGSMPTIPFLALDILREIEKTLQKQSALQLTVQSTVEVITYLLNEKRDVIVSFEKQFGIKIILLPNPYMNFPKFTITKQNDTHKNKQKSFDKFYKPQYTLSDNGLFELEGKPMVKSNHSHIQIPKKKINIFSKIIAILKPKKIKNNKKRNNRRRNKNYYHRNNKK
ncbi:Ribonuclease E [hydrothermal vent metagenome]|uniref:Ribonuclease G n=1 Tax=hydrothermal vent metagenome TaxID=652676 RepID=A0A1W1CAH3_9ZZZZ